MENADFYTAGPTVNVGTLFDHTRIVQIHANAALLLSPGKHLSSLVTLGINHHDRWQANPNGPYQAGKDCRCQYQ